MLKRLDSVNKLDEIIALLMFRLNVLAGAYKSFGEEGVYSNRIYKLKVKVLKYFIKRGYMIEKEYDAKVGMEVASFKIGKNFYSYHLTSMVPSHKRCINEKKRKINKNFSLWEEHKDSYLQILENILDKLSSEKQQ